MQRVEKACVPYKELMSNISENQQSLDQTETEISALETKSKEKSQEISLLDKKKKKTEYDWAEYGKGVKPLIDELQDILADISDKEDYARSVRTLIMQDKKVNQLE